MAPQREILSLTALRGIAALWVLVFHLRREIRAYFPDLFEAFEWLIRSGYLGVDLFFVLSGYVITMNYGDRLARLNRHAYVNFVLKRLARIYPVYLFGMGLAVITFIQGKLMGYRLEPEEWTASGFVQSLFMVQGWTYPIGRHWNIIGWSVSVEWLAYLLFPAFAWLSFRVKNQRTVALVLLLLVHLAYALQVSDLPDRMGMDFGLVRLGLGFTSGTLLWRIRESEERGHVAWSLCGIALVALCGKACFESSEADLEPLIWAPLALTLCIYFIARGADGPLAWVPLIHMGHISYALYVVHGRVFTFARQAFPIKEFRYNPMLVKLVYVGGLIVIAVLLGHLVHTHIEKPARRRILERWG